MMVPVHIFNYDANVSLQGWRCKNLLMGMSWCTCPFGYAMMQMPPCGYANDAKVPFGACHDANVHLWVCHDANVHMVHAMMRMYPCRYAMNVNARLGMQWMPMLAWVCNECKCLLESMPWHECLFVGMQWMQMPPLWVYHDTNALMQTQFIQKFPLFSKRSFLSAWNQNILKAWFIIPEKSYSFWLKSP